MARTAQSISEKMIKVDHAGENGAVNIYRAQKIGAYIFARAQLPVIVHYQKHEEQHREIFATHLEEHGGSGVVLATTFAGLADLRLDWLRVFWEVRPYLRLLMQSNMWF